MKKHWWEEQPIIISAVQFGEDDDDMLIDEYISKCGFNTEQNFHLHAEGRMSYYVEEKHGELLDRYLKKSRKYGIREIIYHNIHCVNERLTKEHPDWLQLDINGNTMPAYNIYNITCVNPDGPFHKSLLKLMAQLAHHDIDGIFLDGPLMRDNGCYCPVCRKTFEETYGHSMDTSTQEERTEQNVRLVTRHVKEIREVVKKINPEILIYMNNEALQPNYTGRSTRDEVPYVDMLGAEAGFYWPQTDVCGLWQNSMFAKYLEGYLDNKLEGRMPTVNFFAGNVSGISFYMHTAAETVHTYAQTYANGSNIWYGAHLKYGEFGKTASCLAANEFNAYLQANKHFYGASLPCSRVALVWSQMTANHMASVAQSDFTPARDIPAGARNDHRGSLFAVGDALIRNHIQFDIIDEYRITDGTVNRYDAVILPGVSCMTKEQADALKAYVKNGGKLLCDYDVGMYTEHGVFRGESLLEDLLGVCGTPTFHDQPFGWANMRLVKEVAPVDKLSIFRIPSPRASVAWEAAKDAEVLMEASLPARGYYDDVPKDGWYPGVMRHSYGKGEVLYVSGNLANSVRERNILDFGRIISRFAEISARPVVKVGKDDGLVEITLRRLDDCYVVHLVNFSGALQRPIESVMTHYDYSVTVNLDGFGIEKDKYELSTLRGGKLTNVKQDGNTVTFTLDKLEAYEAVVIR